MLKKSKQSELNSFLSDVHSVMGKCWRKSCVSYGAKFILVSKESTLTRKENASLCNDECFNRWLAGCLWLWNIFSFIQLFDEIPQIRINFNSTHLW